MTTLWAVSDLHAAVRVNGERIDELVPPDPSDWLIVAGDVAERIDLVLSTLARLKPDLAQISAEGLGW